MKTQIVVLVSTVMVAAGCGNRTAPAPDGHNDTAIENAQHAERTKADVMARLKTQLQLHEYAGDESAFTVPPGSEDVRVGGPGNECSIGDVLVGGDVAAAKGDGKAIMSPDGKAAVIVTEFVGTPVSVCLTAVRDALTGEVATTSSTTTSAPSTSTSVAPVPSGDTAAVRQTVRRFNRALTAGHDRTACELMTDRGQRKLMAALGAASCEAAIGKARTIGASGLSRGNAPTTNIKVTGDRATAVSAGDRLALARTDGRWLMDWK